jgi:DNA-binding response OmpR family regulator
MNGKQTVLVVDDEAKIRSLLKSYLEKNNYAVLCAGSAKEGIEIFEKKDVSLILLDLMLPDFSGEDFCGRIRRVSGIPIIMISAKVDEESIIHGLNLGADDYVTKPFSPRQLVARVAAALRRGGGPAEASGRAEGPFLRYENLLVDTEKRIVSLSGNILALTRDEYSILTLLMSRQAKIFTRDEILDAVKGDDYYGFDRSIDSHIKRLRAKIGDDPRSPRYIVTVYGMGYRFGAA